MADDIKEDELEVSIINPDKIIFEGSAVRIFVPGPFGDIAFLPMHTPLYSELVEGTIIVETKAGKKIEQKIDGGVVRTKRNSIKIMVGF